MILADGVIGQMMEKVHLSPQKPRRTEKQIRQECPWAALGKGDRKTRNIVTSCYIDPETMERHNHKLQAKYDRMEREEVRYEEMETADAEYILVAYGASSRICAKVVEDARKDGLKVGLIRPITLFPFPTDTIRQAARYAKGFLSVELSMGQMIEDVKLAVGNADIPVRHFGRTGGIIHSPREVYEALKQFMTETGGKL